MYAVYYDTETTGTNPREDEIIELAAYAPHQNRSFCSFLRPSKPIPPEVTKIHSITDAMVADAPPPSQVLQEFQEFCGQDAILIAHNNTTFDWPFLENSFTRAGLPVPAWKQVDSLLWSRKYRSDLPRHTLQHLRETYKIPPNQAHRALDDVMVLYQVFSQMIDDLPWETVLSLLSSQDASPRMPFGKHAGKLLQEIPKNYVEWLSSNGVFEKKENLSLKEGFEKVGLL